MAPIIERCQQRTKEWENLHIGVPTAANFHKILTPKRMQKSEQWPKYKYRLIAELLMNEYLPEKAITGESGYWLNRGIDMEKPAAQAFERKHGMMIDRIGFVWNGPNKKIGCSPDGLIAGSGERVAIEIKSPAPWTQTEYLLAEKEEDVWQRYRCQVQGQMIIGQFEGIHFWSYHPRMPPKHVFTEPDLPFIKILRQMLADFVGELDKDHRRALELGTFIRAEEILNLSE